MTANKILKQLTPERIKKELAEIQAVELPADLQKWVKEYEKVGDRDEFLWKWAYKSIPFVTLPNIIHKHHQSLKELKILIIIFITLLDDVADKFRDKKLLKEIIKIPFNKPYVGQLDRKEKNYLKFTQNIWNFIEEAIKKYPRYKELKDIFYYDISQIINTMEYAYLISQNPYLINKSEYYANFTYNLPVVLSSTIDLMCSSTNSKLIGAIREVALKAQKIAQSINWITTWERELKDNDFTSGIFAFAIDMGVLTVDNLMSGNNEKIIKKIKETLIEDKILQECSKDFEIIDNFKKKTSMDVGKFSKNLEKFIILQLSSKGSY